MSEYKATKSPDKTVIFLEKTITTIKDKITITKYRTTIDATINQSIIEDISSSNELATTESIKIKDESTVRNQEIDLTTNKQKSSTPPSLSPLKSTIFPVSTSLNTTTYLKESSPNMVSQTTISTKEIQTTKISTGI